MCKNTEGMEVEWNDGIRFDKYKKSLKNIIDLQSKFLNIKNIMFICLTRYIIVYILISIESR